MLIQPLDISKKYESALCICNKISLSEIRKISIIALKIIFISGCVLGITFCVSAYVLSISFKTSIIFSSISSALVLMSLIFLKNQKKSEPTPSESETPDSVEIEEDTSDDTVAQQEVYRLCAIERESSETPPELTQKLRVIQLDLSESHENLSSPISEKANLP